MVDFEWLKRKLKPDSKHRILLGSVPMILTPRWVLVNVQKGPEKVMTAQELSKLLRVSKMWVWQYL